MSLSHQVVTLYASATTQINPIAGTIPDYCEGVTISIQNLNGSNYVYIGNSGTSSVAFGFRLSPGQSWSADLDPSDPLFATTNDTLSQIAVTRLFWQ